MRLLPAFVVDRLPIAWWRPGNLHTIGKHTLHFCDDDHVRSIEWDDQIVAQGRRLFPYDRWDQSN